MSVLVNVIREALTYYSFFQQFSGCRYRSTEKAEAPDKLLFEISLDPKKTEGMSVRQVAEQFARFSRDSMAKGVLDEIGEQIFTTAKIRKALDRIFADPPTPLIRLIRSTIRDGTIKPIQVKNALRRLWSQTSEVGISSTLESATKTVAPRTRRARGKDHGQEHHTKGRPQEIIELFRTIDKFCRELEPGAIERRYLAKYVRYSRGKSIFCCVHLYGGGLRVWLKLRYSALQSPPRYVRDVSNIGHWGVGDIELAINSLDRLQDAKSLITRSFEENG
jgi:predicted transport protein